MSSSDEEYETQFFGFTPSSFADEVVAIPADKFEQLMNDCSQFLSKKGHNLMSAEDVSEGTANILTTVRSQTDSLCSKLKCEARAIFHIPNYVLLPEDIVQKAGYTQQDEAVLDAQIAELRVKLRNEAYMKSELRKELVSLQEIETKNCAILKELQSLPSVEDLNDISAENEQCEALISHIKQVQKDSIILGSVPVKHKHKQVL